MTLVDKHKKVIYLRKSIRRKVNKEVEQVLSSIVTYAEHKFKLEIS